MKKTIVIAVLCLLTGFALAQKKQRMQFQGYEMVTDGSFTNRFTYYHDSETGQEVVCFNSGGCYLSGRVWSDAPGRPIPSH